MTHKVYRELVLGWEELAECLMAGFDVNVGHSRYSFEEFVEQVAHRIQPGLVVMPAVDGPARFDGGYAQVARVSKEALLNKEAVGMLKKR